MGTKNFEFEVFYDGECPFCLREIRLLKRMDRHTRILFTNIVETNFDESDTGRSYEQLMAEIHGRLPDGSWVTGVEVFRQLYSLVGFGWLVAATRLPGITGILDWAYQIFARYRLRIAGRCDAGCRIGETT